VQIVLQQYSFSIFAWRTIKEPRHQDIASAMKAETQLVVGEGVLDVRGMR